MKQHREWMLPTYQELFDNAAIGIIDQKYRRATDRRDGSCVCMAVDGDSRCALGHSITDATPGVSRTDQWTLLNSTDIGGALVYAHDFTLPLGPDEWRKRMAEIALEYGVDDSVLYFTEKP